jgi:mannose-6-phosphate isomerase-like protein (cupin superfamily)
MNHEKETHDMTVEPVIVPAGTGRMKELRYGRGSMEILVDGSDGAAQLDVHVNIIRPGTEPGPRHFHAGNENAYFVLSGTGLIGVGDEEHIVGQGDFLFIPPGVPHFVHNAGDDPLRLIEIYAPSTVDFVEV